MVGEDMRPVKCEECRYGREEGDLLFCEKMNFWKTRLRAIYCPLFKRRKLSSSGT
jgi:hypothetical protein